MKIFESCSRNLTWFSALLVSTFIAGCGGGGDEGRDPVLGIGGIAVQIGRAHV